jgi:MFS family permease
VPELVRSVIGKGASGFSIIMVGYAAGSIAMGGLLARYPVENKARASLLSWILYLPAYGLFAVTASLPVAVAAAFIAGIGQSAALILLTSAAQVEVADEVLGRVMGVISLVHRGGHATGLLLIAPLFAIFAPPAIFAGAAIAIPLAGIVGFVVAYAVESRRREAAETII